jgi:KaiC/GvpD/RAD55 family RecA-like ATPase
MLPESLELSDDNIKQYTIDSNSVHYVSNFNFLKSHKGIRRNKLHLLIAPTHAGKSTLVRSLLCDFIFRNKGKKILLWLTEESKEEFRQEFSSTVPAHDILANISIVSEMDTDSDAETIQKNISEFVDYYKYDAVFVDNITTSRVYMDKSTAVQSDAALWFKTLKKSTSLFLIAHANTSDFNNRFLDENDIRGSKTITNLAEFLYILQPIAVGDRLFQFINIKKHRGQNISGKFFRLFYSKELKSFDRDMQTDFDGIKEVFKQRNKLNDK